MKKFIVVILLLISVSCFAQLRDTTYTVTTTKKTVIIPLNYFINGVGYRLFEYPCFTLKTNNNTDTLYISGSSSETDSVGFNISVKLWSRDSLITGGKILFANQTANKEYQYMPFTPNLKYLILKVNTITNTIYFRTLFRYK